MALWSALISPLTELISKPVERYQNERLVVKQAKAERQAQEQLNTAQWEENVLIKSSIYLRWFCGIHLFAGLDYTIYAAMSGKDAMVLWEALDLMPDWYAGLLATMFGFAFASSPIKKAGGALAARWRKPQGEK